MRKIKLTYVSFWVHVKEASHIISYLCTTLHIIKSCWLVCVMIRRKTKKDKEINLTVINWVFAQTTLFVGSKLNFVWAWFEVNSFVKDPWSSLMVDEKVDVTWSLEKAIIEKCCWWPLLYSILNILAKAQITHTHTHTRLSAIFWDYPGEPVPKR